MARKRTSSAFATGCTESPSTCTSSFCRSFLTAPENGWFLALEDHERGDSRDGMRRLVQVYSGCGCLVGVGVSKVCVVGGGLDVGIHGWLWVGVWGVGSGWVGGVWVWVWE